MILAALLMLLSQEPAKLSLSLSPPTTPVRPGETVAVGVYLRNTGGQPLDLVPPSRIDAKLTTNASTIATQLVRRSPLPDDKTLPPGQTVYAEYALTLPKNLSGRVVLKLDRLSAPPVVIEVDPNAPQPGDTKPLPEKPPGETPTTAPSGAATPAPAGEGSAPPPGPVTNVDNADEKTIPPAPPTPIAEHSPQRFHAHEPTYFVVGDRPTARFQFSFKYQIVDPESQFGTRHPWLSSLYFGYTQTSLWDIAGSSQPFTDSEYRPELFFSRDRLDGVQIPGVKQFGLQTGYQHDSNGQDGDDSRGFNALYVRPIFFFGEAGGFEWRLMPKIYAYLGGKEGNSDLTHYRGWVDLRLVAGKIDGLEIAALGRLGSTGNEGSIQLDVTYPLRTLTNGAVDIYLQGQYFNGYGESLLTYDEYTESLRFGIGLSR